MTMNLLEEMELVVSELAALRNGAWSYRPTAVHVGGYHTISGNVFWSVDSKSKQN